HPTGALGRRAHAGVHPEGRAHPAPLERHDLRGGRAVRGALAPARPDAPDRAVPPLGSLGGLARGSPHPRRARTHRARGPRAQRVGRPQAVRRARPHATRGGRARAGAPRRPARDLRRRRPAAWIPPSRRHGAAMNDPRLRARYGLKYNPFDPEIPTEDLWTAPGFDLFAGRVEALTRSGGFGMLTGAVGTGKSKAFQALAGRLAAISDLVVGVMERPQSSPSDFYRELGRVFAVDLTPANRYGGFRALRDRWESHLQTHLRHPVLLVDEAQEMPTACLSELRLLGSTRFDSRYLLTVVLAGDPRLPERFRTRELQP